MKKIIFLIFLLLTSSSCLMPHDFVAKIHISPEGKMAILYEGKLINVFSKSSYKEGDERNVLDDMKLDREVGYYQEYKAVKKFKNIGLGQYEVRIHEILEPGESSITFPTLISKLSKNREFELTSKLFSNDQINKFLELNIKIRGKIRVYLPRNAEVLHQNAKRKPWLFLEDYYWEIEDLSDSPVIRFILN